MSTTLQRPEKGEEFFFYTDRKGGCSLESFALQMKEPLDEKILEKALDKAVSCFPLFGMKPVIGRDGYLYLKENHLPCKLYARNQGVWHLGSEETNGYLFRVICDGTFVSVRAHHSLGDGRTIIAFTMTLIYYYLQLSGVQVESEGKIYTEEDRNDPTLLASFLKDAGTVEIGEPHDVYIPQNVFVCPDDSCQDDRKPLQYRIRWKNQELLERVHALQVKATAFLAAVVDSALLEMFEIADQHIVTGIPVDMRSRMKKKSQRNYIGNIRLPYYPEYRNLPFEEQVRRLQQDMDVQMDMANMISRARELEHVVDRVIKGPLVEQNPAQGEARPAAREKGMAAQTIMLTNTGKVSLPKQMEDAIDDLVLACLRENMLMSVVSSFRDQGNMLIRHDQYAEKLSQGICKILKENGISAEYEPVTAEREEERMDFNRFEKVCEAE
ncbi:MAG: hypothetical protein E7280_10080 [Lachnospiraceae bacterium]|jgi:hypothetical protein|nr:hypothetical protein [Lachnospiraceae bacterium]